MNIAPVGAEAKHAGGRNDRRTWPN